jgi:P22_AR N-terminal domain
VSNTKTAVAIPFQGGEVLTVDRDGRPHVILKPAFEAIGLDAGRQINNLRRRSWATTAVTAVVAADGKVREMATADVRTFLMHLATIPESRVNEAARPTLVAYQSEVADAIEQYWTKGVAVNPRATAKEAAEVIAIFATARVGDPAYWDAKARQLAGRVLGETPAYDQSTKPLTTSIYLAEKGIAGKELKSKAPQLGKRVKAAYILRYGEDPPTIQDLVGRHMVPVAQYQEQHRDLFDEAWAQMQPVRA